MGAGSRPSNKTGLPAVGRSRERGSDRRPLYERAAEALAAVLAQTPEGKALPSEPALARQLGVSRATLREAMRSFEERGLIIRRQGVGTYVTRSPRVLESGLEILESLETLAARIGLKVVMGDLSIEERPADEGEAELFGLAVGSTLWQIARVISAESRPVAYLIDRLAPDVKASLDLSRGFGGSVLDLMLKRGEPRLDLSQTEITAISAPPDIARRLNIQRGDVLLCFEASLYSQDGRVIDHSFSYFLPGTFRFHVVRRVGRGPRLPKAKTGG
ncbi:MAG: GntR family transcriptional regulator [Chloroflexota bacterium]